VRESSMGRMLALRLTALAASFFMVLLCLVPGGVHAEDAVASSPEVMLSDLVAEIRGWGLPKGIETGMISKLMTAEKMLFRGSEHPALGSLADFISMVSALDGAKLSASQAAYAKSSAETIMILIEGAPIAVISCPARADVAETLTFDGTQSMVYENEIVGWQWDFGDGETGSSPVVQHAFVSKGLYVVSLTVIDGSGVSSSPATALVEVIAQPRPSYTALPAAKGPEDDTGQVTLALWYVDGWTYRVGGEQTMVIDTWDVGDLADELTLSSATIIVNYGVAPTYSGSGALEWAMSDGSFQSAGIVPSNSNPPGTTVACELLIEMPCTIGDLRNVEIRFVNNDPMFAAVEFDMLSIAFTIC
jgi:hypothetical protein